MMKKRIVRDLLILFVFIIIALLLYHVGFFKLILDLLKGNLIISSFVSGILFTSVFGAPFSVAFFIELIDKSNIFYVSFIGAIGSLLGDYIIFRFVKDRLAADVRYYLRQKSFRSIRELFKYKLLRWLSPFIGALIIASPLPDEIGISMLGFSHVNLKLFIFISVLMNFVGILAVGVLSLAL